MIGYWLARARRCGYVCDLGTYGRFTCYRLGRHRGAHRSRFGQEWL